MINKIGIKNFRVFKDYTEFEIRPITLLTGPNNSGKSSFTKLLLLLKNGLNPLKFEEGQHNLEDFSKILNWDSEDLNLEIALPVNDILGPDFLMHLNYNQGKIVSISINNKQDILLSLNFESEQQGDKNSFFTISKDIQRVYFNINFFTDIILNKEFYVNQEENVPISKNQQRTNLNFKNNIVHKSIPLRDIDNTRNKTRKLNLSNLKEKYETIVIAQGEITASNDLTNFSLYNEIDRLEKDGLLFRVKAVKKDVTNFYENELLTAQNESFSDLEFTFSNGPDLNLSDISDLTKNIFSEMLPQVTKKIRKVFSELLQTEEIELELSPLGNLIFAAKTFDDNVPIDYHYEHTLFEKVSRMDFKLMKFADKLEFVSANRGNQKRVLQNSSDNDIDQIVLEFSKLKNQNLPFLKEALQLLEIKGDLEVERFQNYISVVNIVQENRKITLADVGYGYSQVIPIILKIITMMESTAFLTSHEKGILILEEPEANLHPNLQSTFADILKLAQGYYPNLRFIIETHSEYLIRKLQFLTAKKELQPEQSVIYYFNADKYVSREEPKVNKIEITPTGNLTDTFGPGFYDEATKLKFDLMNINKEQNN